MGTPNVRHLRSGRRREGAGAAALGGRAELLCTFRAARDEGLGRGQLAARPRDPGVRESCPCCPPRAGTSPTPSPGTPPPTPTPGRGGTALAYRMLFLTACPTAPRYWKHRADFVSATGMSGFRLQRRILFFREEYETDLIKM